MIETEIKDQGRKYWEIVKEHVCKIFLFSPD